MEVIPDIPVIHRANAEYFPLTTRVQVRQFICSRELTAVETPKDWTGYSHQQAPVWAFGQELDCETGGRVGR